MIDISDGIALFNECDFFSAHDFFEDIWMDANRDEKEFFQGLVQVSVGCYHLICGNLKGANSQLTKGKIKLRKFEPEFNNVELVEFNKRIEKLLNNLELKTNINTEIPKIELLT